MTNDQPFSYDLKTEDGRAAWATASAKALDACKAVQHHTAEASYQSFENIDSSLSARSQFTRRNYEFFRPNEAIPTDPKDIIDVCNKAYEQVGPVHHVIDLMGDFGCQGIRLVHKDKKIQNFYRNWWNKVGGKERSERFLNLLYRMGTVAVKRSTTTLKESTVKKYQKVMADSDLVIQDEPKPRVREVPIRYTFLNPMTLEVIGGNLAPFVGTFNYGLVIPEGIKKIVKKKNKSPEELVMLANLPQDILSAVQATKSRLIPLDPNKLRVFYYKKDDWAVWPKPMVFSILKDIIVLEKLKLADLAALDGAISNIRLWTLGDIEAQIVPSEAAINKLAGLLVNNPGGGTIDLIWGPDLKLQQTDSKTHLFLGEAKYKPTLTSIYAGLGIPPTLTGGGESGGMTNNFISLKTLTERLEYGRSLLVQFWKKEIELVQEAMRNVPGFKDAPLIRFDHLSLSDESAERALYLQLLDRNVISREAVLERFGESFDIEQSRTSNERDLVKRRKLVAKNTPLQESEVDFGKIALQIGLVTPSQVGLDLEPKLAGEQTKLDIDQKMAKQQAKKAGVPQQGRPGGSKDKTKRKQKKVNPRSKAPKNSIGEWAEYAMESIDSILCEAELKTSDDTKFEIFCNLEPYCDVMEIEHLEGAVGSTQYKNLIEIKTKLIAECERIANRELSYEEVLEAKTTIYTIVRGI